MAISDRLWGDMFVCGILCTHWFRLDLQWKKVFGQYMCVRESLARLS